MLKTFDHFVLDLFHPLNFVNYIFFYFIVCCNIFLDPPRVAVL